MAVFRSQLAILDHNYQIVCLQILFSCYSHESEKKLPIFIRFFIFDLIFQDENSSLHNPPPTRGLRRS